MSALEVIAAGPDSSVQDAGRVGFRGYGVATAGAADRLMLAAANAAVANPPFAAAVEVGPAGARFRVADGPAVVAVAGPGAGLEVEGRTVPPGSGVSVPAGAELRVLPARAGVFAYLAAGGGIALPEVMGSRSFHRRSGLGGPALAPGVRLPLAGGGAPRQLWPLPDHPAGPIRVIPGPQDDHFGPEALALFLGVAWRVDPRSDRMGLTLAGPPLAQARGAGFVSDGVVAGAVQVPGDGRPVILMRDCQTTGGYPKIATVITADLDRLAQLPSGSSVRFAAVARAEAVAAARDLAARIAALAASAGPAGPRDPARLLAENLIDGVVDARSPGTSSPPGAGG